MTNRVFMPLSSPFSQITLLEKEKKKKLRGKEHVIDFDYSWHSGCREDKRWSKLKINVWWVWWNLILSSSNMYASALTFLQWKSLNGLNVFSQPTHQIKTQKSGNLKKEILREWANNGSQLLGFYSKEKDSNPSFHMLIYHSKPR